MNKCERCVHRPICEFCAENTDFKFPTDWRECKMCNTDFDDLEEAVSMSCMQAKQAWDEARDDEYDKTKAAFFKGRWSALKDVFDLMSTMGGSGDEQAD